MLMHSSNISCGSVCFAVNHCSLRRYVGQHDYAIMHFMHFKQRKLQVTSAIHPSVLSWSSEYHLRIALRCDLLRTWTRTLISKCLQLISVARFFLHRIDLIPQPQVLLHK